jgi:putative FmdB family regulatory protein
MPLYEFTCEKCNHKEIFLINIKEFDAKSKQDCPNCAAEGSMFYEIQGGYLIGGMRHGKTCKDHIC